MSLSYGSIGSLQGERILLTDNEESENDTTYSNSTLTTNTNASIGTSAQLPPPSRRRIYNTVGMNTHPHGTSLLSISPTIEEDDVISTTTSLGSSTLNQSSYSLTPGQGRQVMEQSLAKERKLKSICTTTVLLACLVGIMYTLISPLDPFFRTHNTSSSSSVTTFRSVNASFTQVSKVADATADEVPFETIVRGANDNTIKASDIVLPHLFHPSMVLPVGEGPNNNSTQPLFTFPFPTGAYWTNLVLPPAANGFSYPIMNYPYAYQWSPNTLQISYPPLRRMTDEISIRDIVNPDMGWGTKERVTSRYITKFDPLSVTLRFDISEGRNGDALSYWETYLVQGSPYATVKYVDATPVFTPLSIFKTLACPFDDEGEYKESAASEEGNVDHGNGGTTHGGIGVCSTVSTVVSRFTRDTTLKGVQFLIQTQENLTWMLFASEPIELTLDGVIRRTISATRPYTGILRWALVPPPIYDNDKNRHSSHYESVASLAVSSGVRRLIYHSHTYPIGAKVSWDFHKESSGHFDLGSGSIRTVGTLSFDFETRSMHDLYDPESSDLNVQHTNTETELLLMLALPHHAQKLPPKKLVEQFDLQYQCIKGTMAPVIGNQWSYEEHLTDIDLEGDNAKDKIANMDNVTRYIILDQVTQDLTRVLPALGENVYGYGKQVARLAQLAHIAHELELDYTKRTESRKNGVNTVYGPVTTKAVDLLHLYLSDFLESKVNDHLVYDVNFGGIITKNGLINMQEDFGNGWYNDHHFHYGYILYASSVMAKLNSTFVSEFGPNVDAIMYDVTYQGNQDSHDLSKDFFPLSRHKSWFDGHSFASGLFPFADGKSQESSSEAINCYYGAYLWSLMRGGGTINESNSDEVNYHKLLLAMEIRGAKTYWHMVPPNKTAGMESLHSGNIYDPTFESSYMVGNLGMMDVTIATWFGTKPLYVHMINLMPVTSITRELFNKKYVEEEFYNIIEPSYDEVEMAWRGYTIADRGMIDPNGAWKDAAKLRSFELDSAVSKSQIYYWLSTSDGFIPSRAHNKTYEEITAPSQSNDAASASCVANERCTDIGLKGKCCPTSDGTFLGCCNK